MKLPIQVLFLPVALFCASCASIVDGGSDKSVQINSTPPGALVTITNKAGKQVSAVTTPARVSLKRHSGPYSGEDYTLTFTAKGYHPSDLHVKSTMNGWYAGNIVFGGLLGLLLVDPITGAVFTLSPREIDRTMIPLSTPLSAEQLALAEARANPAPSRKKTAATSLRN